MLIKERVIIKYSSIDRISICKLCLFFFVCAFLSMIYISYRDENHLYITVFLFLLGAIHLTGRGWSSNKFSILSYLVLASLLPLYQYVLHTIHGSYFTLGGDAEYYFDTALKYASDNELILGRFWLFIYFIGNYFKLILICGDSPSPAYFALLTMFFASITCRYYYLCLVYIFDEVIARRTTLLWIITPFFLYLGVGQLRDIYTYIAPAYLFFVFAKHYASHISFREIVTVLLLVLYTGFIRIDVTIYCVILTISYVLFEPSNLKKTFYNFLIFCPVLVGLLAVLYNVEIISSQLSNESIERQKDTYSICQGAGCVGGTMQSLKGTLMGYVILPVFSYFTPLPVFLLDKSYNFIHFLEMIFFVVWSYLSIYFILGSFANLSNRFIVAFIISFLGLLTILGMTTVGFFRQKIYVYPIVYAIILQYLANSQSRYNAIVYKAIICLFFSLLLAFYLLRML